MSININKYNTHEAYAVDSDRPLDESCVSLVVNSVVYDGKNIVKTESQLGQKEVCMIVKDLVDNAIKYVPVRTFDANTFDTTRYLLKDWLRYGECKGKQLKVYKTNNGSPTWAAPNRYKINFVEDNFRTGGFHWAITINGTAKSGDCSWDSEVTIASAASRVISQINAVQANMASYVEGDDFVRITVSSYSNSTLTLTDIVDDCVKLDDLSVHVKINGVEQAQTHRTFMAQSVASLFPDLGYLPANSTQYGVNGLNMSNFAGGSLAKYKSYYRTSGSAEWKAETVGRMNEATFNQCADGTIGGANGIALYNKYDGSWDAYMEAGMIKIDDSHAAGVEYKNYDNGAEQNASLCQVTTMTFDGSYVPAYTAPSAAAAISDADLGGAAHLPNNHEMALMMEAQTYADIRLGLGYLSGSTLLSNSTSYWLVSEYAADVAWFYYGPLGTLYYYGKGDTNAVRPVLA